jgi:hypothetical protein
LGKGEVSQPFDELQIKLFPLLFQMNLFFLRFGNFRGTATFTKIQRVLLFGFGFILQKQNTVMTKRIFQQIFDELGPGLSVVYLHHNLLEQTDDKMIDQRMLDEQRFQLTTHRKQSVEVIAHLYRLTDQQVLGVAQRVVLS